jgi:hypothetical protein
MHSSGEDHGSRPVILKHVINDIICWAPTGWARSGTQYVSLILALPKPAICCHSKTRQVSRAPAAHRPAKIPADQRFLSHTTACDGYEQPSDICQMQEIPWSLVPECLCQGKQTSVIPFYKFRKDLGNGIADTVNVDFCSFEQPGPDGFWSSCFLNRRWIFT